MELLPTCRSEWLLGCRLFSKTDAFQRNRWITYDRYKKTWSALPRKQPSIAQLFLPKPKSLSAIRAQEDDNKKNVSEPESILEEGPDVPDSSEDDSPEMLKLQKADRRFTEQQQTAQNAEPGAQRLSVPSSESGPAKAAEEIMQNGFTVCFALVI